MSKPDDTTYDQLAAQLDELLRQNQLGAAIDYWKQLPPKPSLSGDDRLQSVAITMNKRGIQLFKSNHIADALTYFTMALRAKPEDAAALNNLATCLKELGRLEDSTALYQQALVLQPSFAAAHSNILMNMQYQAGVTPAALAAAHREWDKRHGQKLRWPATRKLSSAEAEKKLRIGLVSGDLGQHPVGILLVRYLENIDRDHFTIISYADGQRQGHIADRLRAAVNQSQNVEALSDEALARKIEADNIDILIDLSGHTADNRLGVFARKPAPVQISWLGYPGDTGLSAIDYVIGDPLILPLALQSYSTAKIIHLPDCFICFAPPVEAPAVSPLPATVPGAVTFGCFSNPAKCGDEVIGCWAEILRRLPQSRLLLKYKGFGEISCIEKITAQFAALGVEAARLECQGASPMAEMFQAMQKIDMMLDPFPFSGGLMTCFALWMGLPPVTLAGETFASRQGLSFLTNLDLTDTLASNRQEYIDKAVDLANDLPRLGTLRQNLRPTMAASALCDGPRAARALQDLLRKIWRENCAG